MTDLVLRDIDPEMADRIKRLADARGWNMHVTLENLLQRGLQACEAGLEVHLDDRESTALEQAIAALEGVPRDEGFGLIGRAPPAPAPTHILDRWVEEI
ncbi:hypothetical protein LF41_2081 [Lysobacter dokdonensis DS-58]|uniref:Uncharacterized protein n=1 Tax=Lysobacter dokdonensis DS-58 TaxID=1300345 RepID=A0A0A2WN19_9GAMM|nr:hypothetical protein [Lysobacter dokdonensis]KGQ20127.1 hypothetical protein LF41_2081 [Lysobacter dokdonensis DS-58]